MNLKLSAYVSYCTLYNPLARFCCYVILAPLVVSAILLGARHRQPTAWGLVWIATVKARVAKFSGATFNIKR